MKRIAAVTAVLLLAAACQKKDPAPANAPMQVSQVSHEAPKSPVRSVDFLNFTYKPNCTSPKTVTTKKGVYEIPASPEEAGPVHFNVAEVIYGDLRGDGGEQAVVLTGCNLGGTGYWTEAFVFDSKAGKPVQLESIGGNDRAMGGIKSIGIDGHTLQVAQQHGVVLCCADYIETTSYQLRGDRLETVGNPTRATARSGKPIRTVHFELGTSSGTISGDTGDDEIYELRARAGQVMVIESTRDLDANADLKVNVMDPDGMTLKQDGDAKASTVKLPADGPYVLVVSARNSGVPYDFKVTIH